MPYVFRQGDLPKLDVQVDHGSDFTAWKSQWESYMSLSGLSGESAEKKVQALTLCFSRETQSFLGIPCKTLYQLTTVPFYLNGNAPLP